MGWTGAEEHGLWIENRPNKVEVQTWSGEEDENAESSIGWCERKDVPTVNARIGVRHGYQHMLTG